MSRIIYGPGTDVTSRGYEPPETQTDASAAAGGHAYLNLASLLGGNYADQVRVSENTAQAALRSIGLDNETRDYAERDVPLELLAKPDKPGYETLEANL